MPVQREIMEKAVRQVLEEAKVPASHHLRVIQLLHERMKEHGRDIETWRKIADHHEKHLSAHDAIEKRHEQQIESYNAELERSKQFVKGEPGNPGEDGYTPQKGIDYFDGETPDTEEMIKSVLLRIPPPEKGEPGKDAQIDEKAFMNRLLGRIKNEQMLDLSHIKGAQGFIKDGVKYKFEELMHGGGGNSSGGFSVIAVSGTINDSNTSFSAATQPTLLNINGAFYQKTGGTITWTYAGTAITTSSPVGTGGSIFGV